MDPRHVPLLIDDPQVPSVLVGCDAEDVVVDVDVVDAMNEDVVVVDEEAMPTQT